MGNLCSDVSYNESSEDFQIDNNLYIIVTIFNPCNFNTRISLYYDFVKRLQKHKNIKIYTAECVFGNQNFTVTDAKNPHHLQIRTNDVWWVKENLINLTVANLPKSSQYIAWLDADIEFTNDSWVNETINKLAGGYKVLQLFNNATFLGPNGEIGKVEKSFGSHVANDNFIGSYPHPGLAWAMRKDAFIEMGGLFDLNPVGSGDLHFAHALINNIKNTVKTTMSDGYKRSIEQWAKQVSNVVGLTKYKYMKYVGYVNVDVLHHFHGNEKNRQYVDRWNILEKHKFDPNTFFVQLHSQSGLSRSLRQVSRNVSQSFRTDIINYFSGRKEDELTYEPPKKIVVQNGKDVYKQSTKPIMSQKPASNVSQKQVTKSANTSVVNNKPFISSNLQNTNSGNNWGSTNNDAYLNQQIINSIIYYDYDYERHKHHKHNGDNNDHHKHHHYDNNHHYSDNNNHHHSSDGYLSHHPSYP